MSQLLLGHCWPTNLIFSIKKHCNMMNMSNELNINLKYVTNATFKISILNPKIQDDCFLSEKIRSEYILFNIVKWINIVYLREAFICLIIYFTLGFSILIKYWTSDDCEIWKYFERVMTLFFGFTNYIKPNCILILSFILFFYYFF